MDTPLTVQRIGHRGAPKEFFENTMASFRRAVELGADAVELDVHVTRDGVPIVQHDPDLRADVTPKELRRARIADLTAAEVGTVRFKSGDPIPVLAELLNELASKVFVYVELKGGPVPRVAEVLRRHEGSVAAHSFDHDAIVEMKGIAPAIRRGVLFDALPDDLNALLARTGATDIWPAAKLVDSWLVTQAALAKGRLIPWTVNKVTDLRRLSALGVAGVCTDDLTIFQRA